MFIQNSPFINQAVLPDVRAHGAAPAGAVATTSVQNAPVQASAGDLTSAVAAINQAIHESNRNLEFIVDADTHRTVVRMVDTSTGELIRQFPTETTLAIARGIDQFRQGLLIARKA
jgi:flagellar protein FlaG